MKKTLLALIVGLAVLIPSAALAASSSCQAYGGKTCPTSNTTTSTICADHGCRHNRHPDGQRRNHGGDDRLGDIAVHRP